MTQFKVGDRVRVKETGQEGIVRGCAADLPDIIGIGLDSYGVNTFYSSREIAHIAAKTELVPFYLLLVDGMDTIWSRHNTLEEARKAGNDLLVAGNSDKGATIFKAVEYGQLPERAIEWRKIE